MELVRFPNIEVILLGGRLFRIPIVAVGASTARLKGYYARPFFMGATGYTASGVTTGTSKRHDQARFLCRGRRNRLLASRRSSARYLRTSSCPSVRSHLGVEDPGCAMVDVRAAGPDIVFAREATCSGRR
jgi:DeoR/GlpR family transcriptional regulator of sugar metabolism